VAVDYRIDYRIEYPERSSRGWAALTILLVKLVALIPHAIVLVFLGIAQAILAIVAQFVVAVRGEYPAGMFDFVTGVLRWYMRAMAFLLSLTDRYPPFTLRAGGSYPVDVVAERAPRYSRVYALFTALVEVVVIAAGIWFLVRYASSIDWDAPAASRDSPTSYWPTTYDLSGLFLRVIAAVPHLIILVALWFVTFLVWLIVQWVILFVARYPRGMFDFVAGTQRWQTRVSAYTFGLVDRYPPFTFEPSERDASGGAGALPPETGRPVPPAAR
jgi:hypothetical protein